MALNPLNSSNLEQLVLNGLKASRPNWSSIQIRLKMGWARLKTGQANKWARQASPYHYQYFIASWKTCGVQGLMVMQIKRPKIRQTTGWLTFLQHADSKAFLKPASLACFPTPFCDFTATKSRACVFYVACHKPAHATVYQPPCTQTCTALCLHKKSSQHCVF